LPFSGQNTAKVLLATRHGALLRSTLTAPPSTKTRRQGIAFGNLRSYDTALDAMNTRTLGGWLFGIQFVVFVVVCYVFPFCYVLRTGRFWRGVLFCWLTEAALSFCSMMLGVYLYRNVDRILSQYCFEGPHFLAFAFTGWFQGMITAGIAQVIYRRRKPPA
jgi:hypothetical protein